MHYLLPNTIAKRLANRIVSNNGDFSGKTDEIRYGLEWIISTLNFYVLVCMVAIPLNMLPEALMFAVTSSTLRLISGGAHCKGYYSCLILSTLQVVVSSFIIHYMFSYLISLTIVFTILLTASFITVVLLAPVLNKKKDSFNEKQKHNIKIVSILVFLVFLTLSLTFFKGTHLMYGIWFALIIQTFSLTDTAKRILDFPSKSLTAKEVTTHEKNI